MTASRRRTVGTPSWEAAQATLDALRRLGPTYVRLGQRLALCADLLPASVRNPLSLLPDYQTPVPWPEVKAIDRKSVV